MLFSDLMLMKYSTVQAVGVHKTKKFRNLKILKFHFSPILKWQYSTCYVNIRREPTIPSKIFNSMQNDSKEVDTY